MTKNSQRILGLVAVVLVAGSGAAVASPWIDARNSAAKQKEILAGSYDPLHLARSQKGKSAHREAGIPAQCYTIL
jgi:hypothetical protein